MTDFDQEAFDVPAVYPGPLILESARAKFWWMALGTGFLAAIGLFLFSTEKLNPVFFVGTLFLGICTLVFALVLIQGSSFLQLNTTGFGVTTPFQMRAYKWNDVDNFKVWNFYGRQIVVFDQHTSTPTVWRKINVGIAGADTALPETYGLTGLQLVGVMTAWRKLALARQGDAS